MLDEFLIYSACFESSNFTGITHEFHWNQFNFIGKHSAQEQDFFSLCSEQALNR